MLCKLWIACLLVASAANARVFVRIGPPPVVVETPIPPPGPAFVWTPGYYRWDGRAYVWVPGTWVIASPRTGSGSVGAGFFSKDTGGSRAQVTGSYYALRC
jgi:hypothetical protein